MRHTGIEPRHSNPSALTIRISLPGGGWVYTLWLLQNPVLFLHLSVSFFKNRDSIFFKPTVMYETQARSWQGDRANWSNGPRHTAGVSQGGFNSSATVKLNHLSTNIAELSYFARRAKVKVKSLMWGGSFFSFCLKRKILPHRTVNSFISTPFESWSSMVGKVQMVALAGRVQTV